MSYFIWLIFAVIAVVIEMILPTFFAQHLTTFSPNVISTVSKTSVNQAMPKWSLYPQTGNKALLER